MKYFKTFYEAQTAKSIQSPYQIIASYVSGTKISFRDLQEHTDICFPSAI